MKKTLYTIIALFVAVVSFTGCKKDWTIKDAPAIQERPNGFGYVSGFENGGDVLYAVEVASAGNYQIVVRGRATEEGVPGTGVISAGSSQASFTFANIGAWQDANVTLSLEAGVNDITVSAGDGNGLFHLDYIELK